jgi:hypothetical protein
VCSLDETIVSTGLGLLQWESSRVKLILLRWRGSNIMSLCL